MLAKVISSGFCHPGSVGTRLRGVLAEYHTFPLPATNGWVAEVDLKLELKRLQLSGGVPSTGNPGGGHDTAPGGAATWLCPLEVDHRQAGHWPLAVAGVDPAGPTEQPSDSLSLDL